MFFVTFLATTQSADLYCNTQSKGQYKRGDPALICLHFTPTNKRLAFKVTVDKYSVINGLGTYTALQGNTVQIVPQLQNTPLTDAVTYPYIGQQISNIFSFIIRLDKGLFVNITDDNRCLYCNQTCFNKTISADKIYQNCAEDFNISLTEKYFDPRVFIAWIGTDSNSENMQSSAQRFASFQDYSVSKINFNPILDLFK